MFAPFFCHWYPSGAVPAATTVNVAVCPAITVWFAGCVVIVGAPTIGSATLRVAALLPVLSVNTATANNRTARSGRLCHSRRALRSGPLAWVRESALRRLIEFTIPRLPRED